MSKNVAPNVPYIEAQHQGGRQKPTAIFIYATDTGTGDGTALTIANYWHRPSSVPDPKHYVVDEMRTYNCVPPEVCAGVDEFVNRRAISIAVCSDPYDIGAFLEEEKHFKVMTETVDLVARLCLTYSINNVYLDKAAHRRWAKWRLRRQGGISIQTTGTWPWQNFQHRVSKRMDELKGSGDG